MLRSLTNCALSGESGLPQWTTRLWFTRLGTSGAPLNTVVWYFQIVAAEFRVIDCDSDLDLTPVQRVARMVAKGYPYGSHFLPHDAMATDDQREDVSQRTRQRRPAQLQGGPENE